MEDGLTDSGGVQSRGALDAALRRRWGWLPYRLIAGCALFGCAFAMACDVIMWFLVEGYNPLGQTISELGAGPHHELQDTGIVVFVVGVLSLTLGLVLRGEGDGKSWAVRGAFLLLGADIALIALWNEYGDGDVGGPVIHRYLLMALYLLVPAVLWLGTSVPPARGDRLAKIGKAAALAWLPFAPLFYVVPETVNGAYERLLALVMLGAVAAAAWPLYQKPQEGAQ